MREAVRAFALSGRPVYAECGGLLYLTDALEDMQGVLQPMVGLLPTVGRMTAARLTLGYAEIEVTRATPIGPAGTVVRGHEFHASRLDEVPDSVERAYAVRSGRGGPARAEGYLIGQTLMSYVHLHFGSNPAVAEHLVRQAGAGRRAHAGAPVTVASSPVTSSKEEP